MGAALAVSANDHKRLFARPFRFRRSVAGKPTVGLEKHFPRNGVDFRFRQGPAKEPAMTRRLPHQEHEGDSR
jgi:hypothetical protein